jgi:predicted dehydrogenase
VEKPLALTLDEADLLVAAARQWGVPLYVGYTQRFRRRYITAKQHVEDGFLGDLTSVVAKIYLTQAVASAVISRASGTTPSLNTLTYSIDFLLWCLARQGSGPVSVYAQGSQGRFFETLGVPDAIWAVMTFDDGAIGNLGVSWELPPRHPAYVASMQLELFGREGTLSIQDDHRDALLVSAHPIPSPYTPDVTMNAALLGSYMPGDRALGGFVGAMMDETYAFIAAAGSNQPNSVLASGEDGRAVTALALSIDQSVRSSAIITLGKDLRPTD